MARPLVPVLPCDDFPLSGGRIEGSHSRKRDVSSAAVHVCYNFLPFAPVLGWVNTAPGDGQHLSLGEDVAPRLPAVWFLGNAVFLGVMQTGWPCVRWACPLLTGCAPFPVPFTGEHRFKGKRENSKMAWNCAGPRGVGPVCLHLVHTHEASPGPPLPSPPPLGSTAVSKGTPAAGALWLELAPGTCLL